MQSDENQQETLKSARMYPANEAIAYVRSHITNGDKIAAFDETRVVIQTVTEQKTKILWMFAIDDTEEAQKTQQMIQHYITSITHEEND